MLKFYRFRRNQRGQAVVEMALILPVLIMLIFGIVEFGRILNTYLIVTNLSREGARAGAVGRTDSQIVSVIQDNAAGAGLNTGILTVTLQPPAASPRPRGSSVTVQVTYPVDIIAPLIGNIIEDPYPVSAQTTMRVEG